MKRKAADEWRQQSAFQAKEESHLETRNGDLTDELLELVNDHSGRSDIEDSGFGPNDESNELLEAIGMNILNNLATNGGGPFSENILDLSIDNISEDNDPSCIEDREILLKLDSKMPNQALRVTPVKVPLNEKGSAQANREENLILGQQKTTNVQSNFNMKQESRYLAQVR